MIKEYYSKLTKRFFCEFSKENNKNNVLFSPYSILNLLAMAAQATSGKTRDEIVNAILPNSSFQDLMVIASDLKLQDSETIGLSTANATIIKKDHEANIKADYANHLKTVFNGELLFAENMVDDVNNWVRQKTDGMISGVLNDSNKEILSCLINTILFQADWNNKYEEQDVNCNKKFVNADGSISNVTMLSSDEKWFLEDDSFIGFSKPYKNGFSYVALLPKKKGHIFLTKALKNIDFSALYHGKTEEEVYVKMPEFSCEFGKELSDICTRMGITTLFTDSADFSGMSNERLKLGSIIHKAKIEVNRKGIIATAVTADVVYAGFCDILNFKKITLDRPFVFAIIHDKTELPVFVGMVNQLPDEKRTNLDSDFCIQ